MLTYAVDEWVLLAAVSMRRGRQQTSTYVSMHNMSAYAYVSICQHTTHTDITLQVIPEIHLESQTDRDACSISVWTLKIKPNADITHTDIILHVFDRDKALACMLTYADVCWRMLTCWQWQGSCTGGIHPFRRMRTYADVCWRVDRDKVLHGRHASF